MVVGHCRGWRGHRGRAGYDSEDEALEAMYNELAQYEDQA